VLTAIVVLFGIELVDDPSMRRIRAMGQGEFWVALLTTAIEVGVSVQTGDHRRRGPATDQSPAVATAGQALAGLVVFR
jgi:hypothetical protein